MKHVSTGLYADIKTIPSPFCYNQKTFKAFVLGADPSNFSLGGEETKVLHTVFGIGEGDTRYFDQILKNLKAVGLSKEDVYVQNLVQKYLTFETSKKPKVWKKIAKDWIPILKGEIDSIDPLGKKPVLVTAEIIFMVLFEKKEIQEIGAQELYKKGPTMDIQKFKNNLLERSVFPFYRHKNYSLVGNDWDAYKKFLINQINK